MLSNQESYRFPEAGKPIGLTRLVAFFKIVVNISPSAIASPASKAVCCIIESFRIRPIAYSEAGTAPMPIAVALPVKMLLNP